MLKGGGKSRGMRGMESEVEDEWGMKGERWVMGGKR